MNGLRAIQTEYKGYLFRSRLEARWAVFFDACGVDWEYEPEGYDLADYVLGHFHGDEVSLMAEAFDRAACAAAELVTKEPDKVMNSYNSRK